MNEQSSRSHAIFTITVECSDLGADKQQHVRMGKLHLVDLAVSKLDFMLKFIDNFFAFRAAKDNRKRELQEKD